MRVLISAEGEHSPDWHYVVVDGHGLLVDLDGMQNSAVDPASLTDPTIVRVTWGPTIANGTASEAGEIVRQDGSRQTFFDRELLKPYLAAYQARLAALLAEPEQTTAEA